MLFFDMYIFGIKTVRGKLTGMIVIKYNLTDRQIRFVQLALSFLRFTQRKYCLIQEI